MSENENKRKMSPKENDFWARYAEKLLKTGVKEPCREWYVLRAQRFVYALNGRKLRSLNSAYLDAYFQVLGRNGTLLDWQLLQTVCAVEILMWSG